MLDFAQFLDRKRFQKSLRSILIPYALKTVGLHSRDRLKERFIRGNFKGKSRSEMKEQGELFYQQHTARCFPSAIDFMVSEKDQGTDLLVLSGSSEEWLHPFCRQFGAELICTELEYTDDNVCTGKLKSANVVGKEKVHRLKKFLDQSTAYDLIIAYGDTKSDAHLKTVAHEFHRNFFAK